MLLFGLGAVPVFYDGTGIPYLYYDILAFCLGLTCLDLASSKYIKKVNVDIPRKEVHETKEETVTPIDVLKSSEQDSEPKEMIPMDEMERRQAEVERKNRFEKAKGFLRKSMRSYTEGERLAATEVLQEYADHLIIIPPKVVLSVKEEISNEKILEIGTMTFYLLFGSGKFNRNDCVKFLKTVFAAQLNNLEESSIIKKLPGKNRINLLLEKEGKE